ncbi:MAG TPA: hypothetical protein PLO37_12290 [Candidatus Hydrogenedentes bacterium]|nr:hypothetical protein [Candidatus Hydrogenedentota bacterium]HPG67621.1 hypothetical protein [Candidatus Hydrogenedentota bacterium]
MSVIGACVLISMAAMPLDIDVVRMRGGYLGAGDIDLLPKMAETGMNTAIVKFGGIESPVDASQETRLAQWAAACKANGILFLPCFNYFGAHEPEWVPPYRTYRDPEGREFPRTPCPTDEAFWRVTVRDRFVALAGYEDIPGAVIDLEMYGAENCSYNARCGCARCRQFESDAAYEDAVMAVATECRQAIETVRPDFLLGGLHMDFDSFVNRAASRGFSTPDHPAIAFTEMTYSPGYTDYVTKTVARLQSQNGTLLCCGLWHSKFPAANIPEQLYYLAKDSLGYWIYTLQTFRDPNYSPLPDTPERHWAAIAEANGELDRLAADPAYGSPLKIRAFVVPVAFPVPDAKRIPKARPAGLDTGPAPAAALRGLHHLYAHIEQGGDVAFTVTQTRLGNYRDRGAAVLVDTAGNELTRAELNIGEPVTLKARAEQTGLYGLLVSSGGNIVTIDRPAGWAIHADREVHLCKDFRDLVLLASGNSVRLRMNTQGRGEGLHCAARGAEGTVLGEVDVVGNQELEVAAQVGAYVVLSFSPLPNVGMEDLSIEILAGAEPFIATAPVGLLTTASADGSK